LIQLAELRAAGKPLDTIILQPEVF